jgi:hypothetical protein
MDFRALRQETFPSTLTAPRESGAAGFRAHAGAKSVLVFPGALRALECAFHCRCLLNSAYLTGVVASVNYRNRARAPARDRSGFEPFEHEHEHEHD